MTTKIRRRAIRLIDTAAAALVLLALGRGAYVMVTPLTLETLTVGPALAVAAGVYILAAVLALIALGSLVMLCMVFRRGTLRRRAMAAYFGGVVLFAGLSVATEAWIEHHRAPASEAPAAAPA